MRDFVVLAIILGSAPVALIHPFYGILMWYWIAYFNPHRLAWNIHYFPVAEIIAIPTLIGLPFTRGMNRRIFNRETILLLFVLFWYCITLFHASQVPLMHGHIASGTDKLINTGKILLMTIVTIAMVSTRERLHWLMRVVAISFGLLAIKGALFGFNTAGGSHVLGPPGSFIADNNAFALALDMVIPVLFFIARLEERRWVKLLFYFSVLCSIVSVILTYSRGGLLGLIAVATYTAIRAKRKAISAVLLVVIGFGVLTFAPPAWQNRMHDMFSGKIDSSEKERLITWRTGLNLAAAYPLFGGGLDCYSDNPVYQAFEPEPLPNGALSTGPHSIYFQMLGEHGYPGLLLLLTLFASCFVSLIGIRRRARRCPELEWVRPYTYMFEGGIIAFAISGAFLEFANFDYWYLLVGLVAALKILSKREYREWLENPQAEESEAIDAPQEEPELQPA